MSRILSTVPDQRWFVAHTKPRREKKLVEECVRQGLRTVLPCYPSAHKYRGKVVVFEKPLFPGYVFLWIDDSQRRLVMQTDHLANLLTVFDQQEFQQQLDTILVALEAKVVVRAVPAIGEGARVRIKSGPLRGIEGWVERREGISIVMLRLDFIGQAAAVSVDAQMLELS